MVLTTLAYLKPVQLYGRVGYFIKRRFFRIQGKRPFCSRAGEIKIGLLPGVSEKFDFSFLNVEKSYDRSHVRWYDNVMEKLWRYHLNCFSYLHDDDSAFSGDDKLFLIMDWIERNPDDLAESWEPYVVSKRLTNWVNWFENRKSLDKDFSDIFAESVFFQTRRLFMDLEFHNQANHLFENLKSLLVSSFFLLRLSEGRTRKERIRNWIWYAIWNLKIQIDEQILDDGGHYELSPMYHEEILDGIKEVKRTSTLLMKFERLKRNEIKEIMNLVETCEKVIPKMEEWLSWMTHPDGYIALFNDSAFTGHKSPPATSSKDEGFEIKHLKSSGYFTCRWGKGNYLVMDCGNPSPDFQPGHSHCDGLSFELSLHGKRVIVDAGCGSYQNPEIRTYCRKTSSHNVPTLSDIEQSEIYDFFRIGRRSRIQDCGISSDQTGFYAVLQDFKGNIYSRKVYMNYAPGGSSCPIGLTVEDTLDKKNCDGGFESLLHLSPAFVLQFGEDKTIFVSSTRLSLKIQSDKPYLVEESRYYPEFGLEKKNQMIRFIGGKEKQIRYAIRFP